MILMEKQYWQRGGRDRVGITGWGLGSRGDAERVYDVWGVREIESWG
jgi:hypothetical protein